MAATQNPVTPEDPDGGVLAGMAWLSMAAGGDLVRTAYLAGGASLSLASSGQIASLKTLAGAASLGLSSTGSLSPQGGGAASMSMSAMGSLRSGLAGSASMSLSATCYFPLRVNMAGAASMGISAFGSILLGQGAALDSIRFLAFGPRDEGLLWLRNSGSVDAAEWDPTALAYVDGANRDGGTAMPEGYWESGRLPGVLRRLTRAEVEREHGDALSLKAFTDTRPEGLPSSAPSRQRWARWDTKAQGRTFSIRVVVRESTTGIRAIDLVFQSVSGPDR